MSKKAVATITYVLDERVVVLSDGFSIVRKQYAQDF